MMLSQNFNRRHSPNRRKTRVDAVMELDETRYDVTILDVSFHGMKITAPVEIDPGSAVTLNVLSHKIPAIVHWCKDQCAGLHLLERLEGQTLLAIENAHDELAKFR